MSEKSGQEIRWLSVCRSGNPLDKKGRCHVFFSTFDLFLPAFCLREGAYIMSSCSYMLILTKTESRKVLNIYAVCSHKCDKCNSDGVGDGGVVSKRRSTWQC